MDHVMVLMLDGDGDSIGWRYVCRCSYIGVRHQHPETGAAAAASHLTQHRRTSL